MQESINLTPQQVVFTRAYTDPKSQTFGNALKSGLEAGYSESYSENITHLSPDWLSEFIGKTGILDHATQNLENWVKTEDREQIGLKFKATELLLDLVNNNSKREEDYLDKLLRRNSLTIDERAKVRAIIVKHGISPDYSKYVVSKEQRERMLDLIRM